MLLGAVLEDALRHLCRKHSLPEANSIEPMNAALRKAGIYGVPQEKQITAWTVLRNKAAHGRFAECTIQEARLMYQSVAGFIAGYLGSA